MNYSLTCQKYSFKILLSTVIITLLFKRLNTMPLLLKALFLLILITSISCKIRKPKKYFNKVKEQKKHYDAIIVPGVPFLEESGKWSDIMKLRVKWAKFIWDKGYTDNIIFSGGAVYNKYSECKIMKLYAIETGIPAKNIYLDSTAEHSTENVYYSSCIALKNNWTKLALVTDPYQTKMLKRFLKKMKRKKGLIIDIIPSVYEYLTPSENDNYTIDSKKAISSNFIDIINTQSKIHRLKGTLGKNIDWNYCP